MEGHIDAGYQNCIPGMQLGVAIPTQFVPSDRLNPG